MKKWSFIAIALFISGPLFSQNVGIGTVTPKARLHITDSAVLFSAPGDVPVVYGNPPIEGTGRRMMWYPDKAAFRVGYVLSTEWDKLNMGDYSFSTGYSTSASNQASVSMGILTNSSGIASTAVGNHTIASGNYSLAGGDFTTAGGTASMAFGQFSVTGGDNNLALGYNNNTANTYAIAVGNGSTATGSQSIAIGNFVTSSNTGSAGIGSSLLSSGNFSIAMGYNSVATNAQAIAIGNFTTASGIQSIAVGDNVTANGNNSTAMGNYVSTSGFSGAFVIGDNSTTTTMNSFVADGFRARFAGGYRLFSNSLATIGAVLLPNANAWSVLSDVRMKENFATVDGEILLQKIAVMPLTTWNYKTQDPKTLRHYGPMAQDFFAAFGKDKYGSIGCDTLINQQDFLGVNMIAIQALEKRTEKIETLETENKELREMVLELNKEMNAIKKVLSEDIQHGH